MTARYLSDLEHLVRLHARELRTFLTRRLGSVDAAEDVCQDLFLKLWEKQSTVEVRQPRAYLMRAASNMATDYQRTRGRHSASNYEALQDVIADAKPSPESETDHKQRLEVLCRAVARLPKRCRQVFVLHKFKGHSHVEIAEMLGISRNAVEKNIVRAMGYCRDEMKRHFGE